MKWLDLKKSNASLTPVTSGLGDKKQQALCLVGDIPDKLSRKLSEQFGFLRLQKAQDYPVYVSMRYTRKSTGKIAVSRIPLDEIQSLFPNSAIREMDSKEAMAFWEGIKTSSKNAISAYLNTERAKRALDSYESIGLNTDGLEVFLTATDERFIFPNQAEDPEYLLFDRNNNPNYFLNFSFNNVSDFNDAATSLLREMEVGRLIDQDRLDSMIETSRVKERLSSETAAKIQLRVSEAIEALVQADNYNVYDKEKLDVSQLNELNNIYTNLVEPTRYKKFETLNRRKLLSPSFGILARGVLEAVENVNSLTLINSPALGALSLVPKEVPVNFVSNDKDVAQPFKDVNPNITQTFNDYTKAERVHGKTILASCLSGELPEPLVIDGLKVSRRDHLEALNITRGMDEDSALILVLNGDSMDELGKVSFDSTNFHQHIFKNYNVVEMLDTSPAIMGINEQDNHKRIYIINGKRLVESSALAPLELKVAYNPQDVMQIAMNLSSEFENAQQNTFSKEELQNTNSISDLLQNYSIVQREASKFELNFAQSQYVPLTSLVDAKPSAQPINFVSASREAAIKLVRDIGNPDAFLLNELRLPKEHVQEVWDAEQIDALTLGIWRLKNEKSFLNGDATGKGKGRVLAGLIYWNIINGRKAVFMTSTVDLLSDIWRDIKQTKLDQYINPFFIASDAIVDKSDSTTIFPKDFIESNRDQVIGNGEDSSIHIDANAVFTTYSQFNSLTKTTNKAHKKNVLARLNPRAKWLSRFLSSQNTALLVDESHNVAANTSNQSIIFDKLKNDNGPHLVRSSATWSKDEASIAQCADMFPAEFTPEILRKMVREGGTGAQEILSATLIAEGAMVRREHDFGKRQVEVYESQDYQRNRIATDVLAEIMSLTRDYSKRQFSFIKNKLKNGKDTIDNIEETSFASSFQIVSDMFTNALRADEEVRQALNSLAANEKPIIGVDKTAGTSLAFFYKKMQDELGIEGPVHVDEFPSLKSMLERWVYNEGSRKVKVTHAPTPEEILLAAKENRHPVPVIEEVRIHWREELDQASPQYLELEMMEKAVLDQIPKLPFLPLSPIDYVKCQLEAEGFSTAEVSGRNLAITISPKGGFDIGPIQKMSKAEAQFKFNADECNAIIVTKAGVEGISLHAQEEFLKYSPNAANRRNIQLFGTFLYIVDEEQFFGRGERKGQAIPSRSSKITTGMPIESRILALSERNRLRLSASTTGNSKSLRATNTVPNFLNPFGDRVTAEYLYDNQHVMDLLGFEEHRKADIIAYGTEKEKTNQIRSLTGSVLGRMMLLSYEQQQSLLDDLSLYFNTRLSVLEAQGLDPLNTKVIHGEVILNTEEVLFGQTANHYKSEFDKPVIAQQITVKSPPRLIDTKVIQNEIGISKRVLAKNHEIENGDLADYALTIGAMKTKLLERKLQEYNYKVQSLSSFRNLKGFANVQAALESNNINDVKSAHMLLDTVVQLFRQVKIGDILDIAHMNMQVIITGVNLPQNEDKMTRAYSYSFTTANTKGEVGDKINIDTMMYYLNNDPQNYSVMKVGEFDLNHPINEVFEDISLDGHLTYHTLVTGNMVEAARLNAEHRIGQQVTIKDTKGGVYNAIRLKEGMNLFSLKNLKFTTSPTLQASVVEFIKSGMANVGQIFEMRHRNDKENDTLTLLSINKDGTFTVELPKTLGGRKDLDRNNPFQGMEVGSKNIDSRTQLPRKFIFRMNQLEDIIDYLNDANYSLQIPAHRAQQIDKALKSRHSEMLSEQDYVTEQFFEKDSDIDDQIDIEEVISSSTTSESLDTGTMKEANSDSNEVDDALSGLFSMN